MSYTNGLDKPTDYFNTKLYTGDGTSSNAITGVGFQPDWIWIKKRNSTASHRLLDSIRGVQKHLASDNTDAEVTQNSVMSFDTDGFTVGNSAGTNGSSDTFASWNWLAGGSASSNTNGDETTSVSVNQTAGFSIVSYTGTGANDTFGHGLGAKPSMIITKSRDTSGLDWRTYHSSLGATKYIVLNLSNASTTESNFMNNTEPTTSVFTLGTGTTPNKSGDAYIAYCFAEKKGYSKFGSYTGNGNADGTFVYTGFKPAFIITKSSSSGGQYYNWGMWDTARSPSNVNNKILAANTSDDESNPSNLGANQNIDFLSNGFKHRSADVVNNQSGVTYIYMCFAEAPFVTSTGIPTTAR